MRISNWTQFATHLRRPAEPGERPVHGGRVPRARGLRLLPERRRPLLDRAVGVATTAATPRWPRCRQPATPALEAFRAVALEAADGDVIDRAVRGAERGARGGRQGGASRPATASRSRRGTEREEHDGLTLKKGRSYIVTKVNAASKLIRLEETGASLPERARRRASTRSRCPRPSRGELAPTRLRGRRGHAQGLGGLAAVDEITMVCVPRPDDARHNGDDAHAARPAGQDDRPLRERGRPHGDPRRAAGPDCRRTSSSGASSTAGYDSKFATLYYPWLEVMDPITNRPIMVPPSGHVAGVWARTDSTRGVHKAPANEVVLGANGLGLPDHARGAGRPQPGRHQLHPGVPRPRHPHLGRAHAVERPRVALPQRAPAVQLHRRVDHRRARSGRCSSPTTSASGCALRISASNFLTRTWREGALFGATPEQAFYVKCDDETNPPEVIEAGQVVDRDRHRAGQARRVRDLPDQPVHRRRRRGRRRDRAPTTRRSA